MKTERKQRTNAQPIVLTSWAAKRAGPAITVEGVDAHGHPHKVVGVGTIVRRSDAAPIATGRDGRQFELA